jgi:hypothetical protein
MARAALPVEARPIGKASSFAEKLSATSLEGSRSIAPCGTPTRLPDAHGRPVSSPTTSRTPCSVTLAQPLLLLTRPASRTFDYPSATALPFTRYPA